MPVYNCTTHYYISHVHKFLAMKKTSQHHPFSSSIDSFAIVFLTSTRSQLLRKASLHPIVEDDNSHQDETREEKHCERRQDVEEHCGREGVDDAEATTAECNTTEQPPTINKKETKKKNVTFSHNVRIREYDAPSCSVDDDELSEYSEATYDDCNNIFDVIFCVACV